MLGILAMLVAGGYGYHWYKNLPKPRLVTAVITSPKITPVAETMVPEFSNAVKEMKKGEITQKPVKSQFGYHIIRLDDSREVVKPTLAELKSQIESNLADETSFWDFFKFWNPKKAFSKTSKFNFSSVN